MEKRNQENRVALPLSEKLSYMSGGLGVCICFMIIGSFLLYVYTDVFMISPVIAANIFLFTRFWDAINDPIMGWIVDKRFFAKSGKGVYKPWILIGTPLIVITFVLCFTLPKFITTDAGKVAWCVLFYILYTMAQTVYQVPYGAMTNAITTDTVERGSLGTYRNFGENIAALIMSLFLLRLVSAFSNGGIDMARGYSRAVLVLAVIGAVFMLICFFNTKERAVVMEQDTTKHSIKENFSMLFRNRPALILVVFLFVCAVVINFRFAYLNYYIRTYMGGGDAEVTTINSIQTAMSIVSFWIVNWMFKKFEKRTLLVLSGLLFAIDGLLFMIGGTSMAVNIIGSILFGFLMALSFSSVWGTVADTVEYGDWKTGICAPAFLFAIVTFAQKCGIGIASYLGGNSLSWVGYVAGEAASEATKQGVFMWHNMVLIIGGAILFLVSLPYNLSKDKYCDILQELDQRRLSSDSAAAE